MKHAYLLHSFFTALAIFLVVNCSSVKVSERPPPIPSFYRPAPPPLQATHSPEELKKMEVLEKYRQMRQEEKENPGQYRQYVRPPQTIVRDYRPRDEQIIFPEENQSNYPTDDPARIEVEVRQNIDYFCIKTERTNCQEFATEKYEQCRGQFPHYDDRRIISCVKAGLRR